MPSTLPGHAPGFFVSGCSRQKCVATANVVGGLVGAKYEFEQMYLALVEWISGYPMPETTWAVILTHVEAIYR